MWRSPRVRVIVALAFCVASLISICFTFYFLIIEADLTRNYCFLLACAFLIAFRAILPRALYLTDENSWRSSVIDALLPFNMQKDVYANFDDLMPLWVTAHGARRARRIRRAQVARIVVGHYGTVLLEALIKVAGIVRGR